MIKLVYNETLEENRILAWALRNPRAMGGLLLGSAAVVPLTQDGGLKLWLQKIAKKRLDEIRLDKEI
ncbi:MAG: hypothetical protein EBR82_75505 [Caulobacteraceae bacterium]|nr:hypothetical protein [Caulobacteraceae bacterium]